MRGIFFDEDAASAAVSQLIALGYDARLERERLSGEDDDEDHQWAVLSDAPAIELELLVEQYDGWLDDDAPAPPVPAPPDLPSAPRTIKRTPSG